jgi:hypothetical protein
VHPPTKTVTHPEHDLSSYREFGQTDFQHLLPRNFAGYEIANAPGHHTLSLRPLLVAVVGNRVKQKLSLLRRDSK